MFNKVIETQSKMQAELLLLKPKSKTLENYQTRTIATMSQKNANSAALISDSISANWKQINSKLQQN
jgi:hypothetical protein